MTIEDIASPSAPISTPASAAPVGDVLAAGRPRFADERLARIARERGDAAAWQQALAEGRARAVATALAASGEFAVGLRDPAGRAFLAVDRFAIRTLCYRVVDGELRFAARADELADRDAELDPQALFDYLYFHAIPSPRTIFKDVRRLPPGHYAWFESGRLEVRPYWLPDFREPRQASFAALREEFHRLLGQAVARHLDDGKPACFLSGGTDSSTVAGMIARVSGQAPASYSIGFEAEGYDEMEYARLASRHFRTEHHEHYVTPDDVVRSIPEVAAHHDQPFGNSSALPAYHCARLAQGDGVRRLLAGDGGDELFGGNARYAKQRVFDWYGLLPGALRRGLLEPILESEPAQRLPLLAKGRSYVEQARVPMPERLQMYNLLMRLQPADVLAPGFLARVDVAAPARQQREVWGRVASRPSLVNRTLAFDWRYTLAESDLPKVRGAAEMAGIGVGFPLLDDELLAFSLRLPTHYKLRGLKLRWFFKEALRGFLPDEIIAKKKHGFGLPFGAWLARHEVLRRLAADSLQGLAARGIVRVDFVERLLGSLLPQHPGYYGEMVWILVMLEQWMRHHAPRYEMPE